MRRMTLFLMALAMVLSITQCKKEQIEPQNEGNAVMITLNVGGGNNGSKANVNPPHVTFENGDVILVGYNGAYVGTLTNTEYETGKYRFQGSIDATVSGTQKLYFYFVGNKNKTGAAINVGDNTYTVDISDQTNELPVLSLAASTEDFETSRSNYSACLQNQCALVKFSTASTTDPVHVGGLYTEAQINFAAHSITNNGNTGFVNLYPDASDNTAKWAILLPQEGFDSAEAAIAHEGYTATIPTIAADGFITGENAIAISSTSNNVYLDWLTSDYEAADGQTLKGTLNGNYKISIADNANVTLDGVNININDNSKSRSSDFAGITCNGNATLNLYGGSIIHCASEGYPGIQAGPSEKTLTIQNSDQGTGTLDVQGGSNAAGIGGGSGITCGNISLLSGAISACGGQNGAGIGSGKNGSCGNIEIGGGEISATGGDGAAGIGSGSSEGGGINAGCGGIFLTGGTINACGGDYAAGIGSGQGSSCSSINIQSVIIVATGGIDAAGIGSGSNGSCGTIEVEGGSINATGGEGASNNIGAGEGGSCGIVTQGALSGLFSVSDTKQVRFSRGNLLSDGTFADNQWYSHAAYVTSNGWSAPSDDWYVLSADEWTYLYQHSTLGFATVNDVPGLIILPDNYSGSITKPYDFNNTTYNTNPWNDNIYSGDDWATMENNGVVFLPTRNGGSQGYYWSSSGYFKFVCQTVGTNLSEPDYWNVSITRNTDTGQRYACVRLVRTEQTN